MAKSKQGFRKARKTVDVSPGESVRIIRQLQGLSQTELAKLTGIPQSTISAIENDRIRLGVERAKVLARALRCHPAVLVFPGWDVDKESAAYRMSPVQVGSSPFQDDAAGSKPPS